MPVTADPEQVAYWESKLDAALADHDAAEEALIVAKASCDAACADAQAAVAEEPTEDNHFAEEAAHEPHRPALVAAYVRFGAPATAELNLKRAKHGLAPRGASNPASPGVTEIDASVAVYSEVAPG